MSTEAEIAKNPRVVPGSRRGQPGRPRKGDLGIFGKQEHGHNPGTLTPTLRSSSGEINGAGVRVAVAQITPRLLDLHATAAYLGVSTWTARDLEAAGIIRRVRIPLPNHGEVRKLLFDREDLERLVMQWKDGP